MENQPPGDDRVEGQPADKGVRTLQVRRGPEFRRLLADATNVELVHDMVEISLMSHSRTPTALRWIDGEDTPDSVRREVLIEEIGQIRMSIDTANRLSMNIIAELAQAYDVDLDRLDFNLKLIRDVVVERKEQSDAEG